MVRTNEVTVFQVKERDGKKCVISGKGGVVDACHVVPFAVTKANKLANVQ